jgi:hypothetical protein
MDEINGYMTVARNPDKGYMTVNPDEYLTIGDDDDNNITTPISNRVQF